MTLTLDREVRSTATAAAPLLAATAAPRPEPALLPLKAVLLLVVFVALVGAGLAWHSPGEFVVTVNGRRVALSWTQATVEQALRRAGVPPHDGVLYSAASRRVLDADAEPARIQRNGSPVGRAEFLHRGDSLTVVNGRDRTEDINERHIPLLPQGLPEVEAHLWIAQTGSLLERTGARTGELVDRRVLAEPGLAARETKPVVALTFDDGPDPRWTPAVLEILRDEDVTATFCVVGSLARRHPDLVKAVADAGHTLCNHTDHHVVNLGDRDPEAIIAELADATAAVVDATGQPPAFYRAPGGTLTPAVIEQVRRQGMRVLGWSVDPFDWKRPGSGVIEDRVVSNVGPGSVILLHDGGGDRAQTVAQLRGLIQRLRDEGYGFTVPGGLRIDDASPAL